MTERVFTVAEANELIPKVRATLEQLREMKRSSGSLEEELQQLRILWGEEVRQADHPYHDEYDRYLRAIVAMDREIAQVIEVELLRRGMLLPLDGLERGFVHFPTTLGVRRVFLCWAFGKPEVNHWHEEGEGHSARRTTDLG
jgi:hypothetical protein